MKRPTGIGWLSLFAALVCGFGLILSLASGQLFFSLFNGFFAGWNGINFWKNINRPN